MSSTLFHAVTFVTETEIAADGNQAIGWLAGIFTLIFFIVVGLLLWSFSRVSRRAKAHWSEIEAQDAAENAAENQDSEEN